MTEKTGKETQQAVTSTAENPLAEMCERFVAQCALGCGSKDFDPSACCSGSETASTVKCGEQAAERKASS